MYAAILTYTPDPSLSEADIEARFEASTPMFVAMPGLITKYFCFDSEKREGVSLYIWESEAAAKDCFDSSQFQDGFRDAFGCEPTIRITPVQHLVDNA